MIKLNHFAKNTRELFLVFKLNLNLILSTQALHTHVGIKNLTKHAGSLFKRLRRCRPRSLRCLSGRKQRSKIFCRSYGKALCNNLLSKSNSSILIGNCKNRTCMTCSKFTLKNHLLNNFGEIEKAQRVCNCRARLANSLRQCLLGHTAGINELAIALSLFDGIQIRTLKVFDKSKSQHLFIINIFNDDRQLLKTSKLRRLITTLTSDDLIAVSMLANQKRLQNTMFLD